ncbi:hypothetical protein [Bacillus sp. FJAT-50079]|uniref:hypothetical protein n=1 Tax=Bacillus sp. FJAT-50079 TaxID=2833577 RepID=UPI001BC8D939|nr:hypothetical protein [Bacillus sp. FJAT-50079]MBS4208834.1 hypothetical protein [Bacillus sp. FJAT-50079]
MLRLLKEAKKQGLMKIKAHTPVSLDFQLSETLRKKLNLKGVLVSDSGDVEPEASVSIVAEVVFFHIERNLVGRTIKAFVDSFADVSFPQATVIQIVGHLAEEIRK